MDQGDWRVLPGMKPTWIVCEDGREYLERCQRFLGQEFAFLPAASLAEVQRLLPGDAVGLLLDLDFRRAATEVLVDEEGRVGTATAQTRRQLSEVQGVLVLRALRRAGVGLPAILCADVDDVTQWSYLRQTLAPLDISASSESVLKLAERMRTVRGA